MGLTGVPLLTFLSVLYLGYLRIPWPGVLKVWVASFPGVLEHTSGGALYLRNDQR